jgi:hypothetical protein
MAGTKILEKPTMGHTVTRLDRIISELERLHGDAQEIFDTHIDVLLRDKPHGTSFGVTKLSELAEPAGSTLDYVRALKLVRERVK